MHVQLAPESCLFVLKSQADHAITEDHFVELAIDAIKLALT